MSKTPEHDKRSQPEGLHPDIVAAYKYVDSVVKDSLNPNLDIPTASSGFIWNGWSIREAFLAGISYKESQLNEE